jgi:hypothetical protein
MKKKVKFYKEEGDWFIDLPEYINEGYGTQADLQMVAGADTLLEDLSYGDGYIELIIADEYILTDKIGGKMGKVQEREGGDGADYVTTEGHKVWLCPVTSWLFGGHYPEVIHFSIK